MADAAPAFITAAPPDEDRLTKVRGLVAQLREQHLLKADLEQRLEQLNKDINYNQTVIIPDALDEVGISSISLASDGNSPPATIELKPYYSANIAAGWPPERRAAGFNYLTETGNGDLIKTEVVVSFGRGENNTALDFAARARDAGLAATIKENVHAQTLTAWLKDQVERHNTLPDLDKIGGSVGRIARIKMEDS